MTAREAAEYINKRGTLRIEGGSLTIDVKVLDARKVYGRIDVLVTPIEGEGEAWFCHTKVDWKEKFNG